jgi:hypothetical protein
MKKIWGMTQRIAGATLILMINPDNDYRKMLTLGQTVTLFDHQVNICYDSSSTVSVLSADVRIPGVVEDVKETRGVGHCPQVSSPW